LLPARFAVYVGGGFCWRFNFSFGRETISAGRLNFVDRLWLLSSVASEKMSKQAEREQLDSVMGVRGFRGHRDLLSAAHG
jgi:hypothetical protein